MEYVIKAKQFITEDGMKKGAYLHIKNEQFGGFVDEVPEHIEVVDFSAYTIAPGLFDTHIHGIKGYDVMDGKSVAIQELSKALVEVGVTRFLPTTLTSSAESLEQAIIAVTNAVDEGLSGAQSEGIFLEGPYFTERYKGAQNPAYFSDPSVEQFLKWQLLAKGQIVKIALAPEREDALSFIERLRDEIVISLGHTDASLEQCVAALDQGASVFVHLYNGMSGMHHRQPGVVGAALSRPDAFAEMICDGHHVHPNVAALTARLKGKQLVLISDCMRAGLMPDGDYHLGEFAVKMENGIARTETGSLAGSTLTLLQAVRNLAAWSGLPLYEVWHYASLSPAKSVGKSDVIGSIAPGKYADFVVLNEELDLVSTYVDGVEKFRAL